MDTTDPNRLSDVRSSSRRQVFEEKVTVLMDRLYGTALRLTRNPEDAEDVVAETVAKAWKQLDQLNDPSRFEGWLFRILNRTFISQWRRRKCRQEREVALEPDDASARFSLFEKLHQPFLLWWSSPEKAFINALLQEDLQNALDSLPDAFRVVIVLVEIEGYTYDEASQLLSVPLGTVRSRLNRARGLLQKALWDQGRDAGLVCQGRQVSNPEKGGTP